MRRAISRWQHRRSAGAFTLSLHGNTSSQSDGPGIVRHLKTVGARADHSCTHAYHTRANRPVTWHGPVLEADCFRDLPTAFRSSSRYLDAPHEAPHPDCSCGIHAGAIPDLDVTNVDFRAVTGIVAVWGGICEAGGGLIRAQSARVCALGVYEHASQRHRLAVREIGEELECDLLDVRELGSAAIGYGKAPAAGLIEAPA
jgi:hypothetical protein